jgi:hypothetical protein
VIKDYDTHIRQLGGKSKEVTQKTKDKVTLLGKEVSRRKAEIHELTRAAERTAEGVSNPLIVFVSLNIC